MNILFVCRSNTERSQIAEAIFNELAFPDHQAKSAGTLINNKEHRHVSDRPAGEALLRAMNDVGLDIGKNERKEVTSQMIDQADKIVVMAEPETVPDYLRNNDKVVYWEVVDPKGMPYETVCKIRDDIKERVRALIKELDASAL